MTRKLLMKLVFERVKHWISSLRMKDHNDWPLTMHINGAKRIINPVQMTISLNRIIFVGELWQYLFYIATDTMQFITYFRLSNTYSLDPLCARTYCFVCTQARIHMLLPFCKTIKTYLNYAIRRTHEPAVYLDEERESERQK